MALPRSGSGGQQNLLFSTSWMQKLCVVEWLEFCDRSQEHVEGADLAGKESAQDVKNELAITGHGITHAINVCKGHVDRLEAAGQVDGTIATDLKSLLDKLKERALEDRKKKAEGDGKEKKKTKATTPEETAKFHKAMTGLIEIERGPVEMWINGLSPADKSRLIKSVVAMNPEQASRALQDIAVRVTDDRKTARARANALIGQEEPSILALALLDLAKADQSVADQFEAHLAELHSNNSTQYAHMIDQLALFDDRSEMAAVLKELGKSTDFDTFLQKCRNRHFIR